jgi:tetratricopeptide (TPR) repeat protein
MEEEQFLDHLTHETARDKCANCNNPGVIEGFATPLCADCRRLFIKYPIPLWIKIFAGGIVLAMLFSLIKFPENLSYAIHQERGKEAEKQHKYRTVEKEFEQVLKRNPDNKEAKGYLMLASFYNEEYDRFAQYAEELEGLAFGNDDLLGKLNDAIDQVTHYFPDPDLEQILIRADSLHATLPDTALRNFAYRNPRHVSGLYIYAAQLFDADQYTACDSVVEVLFRTYPDYSPALRLMASCKRQTGDLEASLKYCDRLLEINLESVYGYAIKARTLLKQKKDREALAFAKKSMSLDDKLPYNIATLALAYHFNNELQKRDELINQWKVKPDSSASEHYQYVMDVIDQKEPFRN